MAKLSDLMKAAGDGPRPATVARPVSHVQMADLLNQLKEPSIRHEPTPFGTMTRDTNDAHNRHIVARVESMRDQLATRRGLAKEAFSRARGV